MTARVKCLLDGVGMEFMRLSRGDSRRMHAEPHGTKGAQQFFQRNVFVGRHEMAHRRHQRVACGLTLPNRTKTRIAVAAAAAANTKS